MHVLRIRVTSVVASVAVRLRVLMLVMRRVPAGVPISRAMLLLLLLLILWVARVARMVLLVSWSALGAVYLGAVGATMWGVARLRWIRVATTSFSSLWLLSVLMPVLLVARSVGYVHRVTRSSSRNHTIVKASPSPLRSHTRLLLLRWPCDTRHRGERRVSSGPTAITTPAPRIAHFSARSKLIVRAAAADAETMCAGPTVTRPLGPASTPPRYYAAPSAPFPEQEGHDLPTGAGRAF